jgi:hypothetical protein
MLPAMTVPRSSWQLAIALFLAAASTGLVASADVLLPIHTIQGAGDVSPYLGTRVTTTGVVTAIARNGFYLQTPDTEVDDDPATSEGLFIYTGAAPPSAVQLATYVRVTGTVSEYRPSSDPASLTLTELASSPAVTVLATQQPLPAPVELTPAMLDPDGAPDQLERCEGMRVAVASLTVTGPSGGTVSEANASASSNGVFFGVPPGVGRPFRAPGVWVLDQLPDSSPCCVPRTTDHPERLRVDSDALVGSPAIDVASHAVVSGLVGLLDYGERTYTLLPEPGSLPAVSGDHLTAASVAAPRPDEITVAAWNLQRFFDTTNDPGVSDVVLSPEAFARRLAKASSVIRLSLALPDILAVEEAENLVALQALADRVNSDAEPNRPAYRAYLVPGNDPSGINVGFLVNENTVDVSSVTQEGAAATYTDPNTGKSATLNDRPPLVLAASVASAAGPRLRLVVIVNHLRSLDAIDDPTDGPRVRAKRQAQAEFLADLVQRRQLADSNELLIVLGDFNSSQTNDGWVDVVGTIIGRPAPADQVVIGRYAAIVDPPLIPLVDVLPPEERYSYVHTGIAEAIDHILISTGLRGLLTWTGYVRVAADFPEVDRNTADQPERLSDHDPVAARFLAPPVARRRLLRAATP